MNTLYQGVLKAWEKLGAPMQLLTGCLVIGLVWLVTTSRTDTQKSNEFVIQQLRKCEENYAKCLQDRENDNRYWNNKFDTLNWKIYNLSSRIKK